MWTCFSQIGHRKLFTFNLCNVADLFYLRFVCILRCSHSEYIYICALRSCVPVTAARHTAAVIIINYNYNY